ncbi:adenylosuccinate lyase, partial [Candidatus Aerophobetes bacterium]
KKNIELTKGLIFSQRVMLALIDKGLSRQKAYELVQRNAMTAWKGNKNFLSLLKADPEVTATLPPGELEPLFDEQYYLRYIDEIFRRVGLTEAQWKGDIVEPTELTPRAI